MEKKSSSKSLKRILLNGNVGSVLFALIGLCILWSILSPYFLTWSNFKNIAIYSSYTGIMACGLSMVLLTGSIDLSQMPMMALCGMMMAISFRAGVSGGWLFLIAALCGVLCGVINALIVNYLNIIPFVATLGTQLIFRACAFMTTNGVYITIKDSMIRYIGHGEILGLPVMLFIMAVVFVISWFILKYTQFGRNLYSCGSSAQAAHLSGINVKKTKVFAYIGSGVCCGIASVVYTAQTGVALNNAGTGAEMDVMASVIIGGMSMAGGQGNIINTLLGVILMSVVANGMGLLGLNPYFQMLFKGIILIAAIFIDTLRNRAE